MTTEISAATMVDMSLLEHRDNINDDVCSEDNNITSAAKQSIHATGSLFSTARLTFPKRLDSVDLDNCSVVTDPSDSELDLSDSDTDSHLNLSSFAHSSNCLSKLNFFKRLDSVDLDNCSVVTDPSDSELDLSDSDTDSELCISDSEDSLSAQKRTRDLRANSQNSSNSDSAYTSDGSNSPHRDETRVQIDVSETHNSRLTPAPQDETRVLVENLSAEVAQLREQVQSATVEKVRSPYSKVALVAVSTVLVAYEALAFFSTLEKLQNCEPSSDPTSSYTTTAPADPLVSESCDFLKSKLSLGAAVLGLSVVSLANHFIPQKYRLNV